MPRVIYHSTDKAANSSNFYGMTKAIGLKQTYAIYPDFGTRSLCSSKNLMKKQEIRDMLERGRFLP